MFSEDRGEAVKRFKEYNEAGNKDKCMDDEKRVRLTDKEAGKEIKGIEGMSLRQISRILGTSLNMVFKA